MTFEVPDNPADLDGDGFVDGPDLGILLGNWGQDVDPSEGELGDGPPVDGVDLGILLGPPLGAASVPNPPPPH